MINVALLQFVSLQLVYLIISSQYDQFHNVFNIIMCVIWIFIHLSLWLPYSADAKWIYLRKTDWKKKVSLQWAQTLTSVSERERKKM